MAHTFSCRSCAPGNKGYNWLVHRLDKLGGIFFIAATNLAAHNDSFGAWIGLKQFEVVREGGADDGSATDTNTGVLPEAGLGEQCDNLVGERARARDKAYGARSEDL